MVFQSEFCGTDAVPSLDAANKGLQYGLSAAYILAMCGGVVWYTTWDSKSPLRIPGIFMTVFSILLFIVSIWDFIAEGDEYALLIGRLLVSLQVLSVLVFFAGYAAIRRDDVPVRCIIIFVSILLIIGAGSSTAFGIANWFGDNTDLAQNIVLVCIVLISFICSMIALCCFNNQTAPYREDYPEGLLGEHFSAMLCKGIFLIIFFLYEVLYFTIYTFNNTLFNWQTCIFMSHATTFSIFIIAICVCFLLQDLRAMRFDKRYGGQPATYGRRNDEVTGSRTKSQVQQ